MKIRIAGLITVISFMFAAAPSPQVHADVADWQQGINVQPASASDFGTGTFQQSIDKAAADGVSHITLVIPVRQSNINSTDVAVSGETPTDASLSSAVRYIQSKGMSAGFVIHDNPYDGQWRALINPSDRATWFANYGGILNRYASLAQGLGVTEYILGTELSSMTDPNVNPSNTAYWQQMIRNVRSRYTGMLTYSAQHSYYKSDLMSLGFWPQLDRIGISAYYSLSGERSPSVQTIKAGWDNWNNSQIRTISERYNKPVVFTELGYVSRDYALRDPGTGYALDTPYNGQIQADGYQALFEYWNNYPYVQGVSLWDWKSNPNAGGAGDRDYTPQNKPAEKVMQQWFTGNSPSPTQPPTYAASARTAQPALVNNPVTVTTTVTSSQPASGMIVDVEIYNSAGQRTYQQAYDNQSLSSTSKAFDTQFTPTNTGNFTVKVGIFTAGWQSNPYWNDAAYTFTVSTASAQPPQPAPSQPVPAEPAASQPAPSQPAPAALSVWWPGEGVTVSGVQPFKAVIDGYDITRYRMYWQVDGGALNIMGTETGSPPYKLAYVDLTNWKWSQSGQYTITFVAQDLAGNVIGKKSVVITVR